MEGGGTRVTWVEGDGYKGNLGGGWGYSMFTLSFKGNLGGRWRYSMFTLLVCQEYGFTSFGFFLIIFLTPPHTHSPAEMFVNRLEVDFIDVNNSVKLDANHMVVVYKQEEGKIDRRIVQGPTIFVPNAHEW